MKLHNSSLLPLLACLAWAQPPAVHFQGEVSRGREFRKEIGRGLTLALRPAISPASEGWEIIVYPSRGAPAAECRDFVWVATPPYRGDNPRYLDTSYGNSAKQAVGKSVRQFSFVTTAAECWRESDLVKRVLWPYSFTEAERSEAMTKLGSAPRGTGRLKIVDYRLDGNPEFIDWLKFDVEIQFPAVGGR